MAEKEQQVEVEKKSSKMLIIIVIVAIVLILGGGAAAYFLMDGHSNNSGQDQDIPEEKAPAAETFYYDISKPLIVDFPKGSSARLIQVSLAFLVEGKETLDALKKHDPMIRNNLLMLISAEDVDSLNSREGKERLRANILREVSSVLEKMTGENHVTEVFFTAFVMQ